jgi:DNA (cytosine-5)-methyltransferase 1
MGQRLGQHEAVVLCWRSAHFLSYVVDSVQAVRAISLFSGAGGLDLGTEGAGFRTVAAVESDATARATLLENAPRYFERLTVDRVLEDVLAISGQDLLEVAGIAKGEVDLLVGGPPCTPFSKSGYWLAYKRAGEDPKASLLDEYVRLLAAVQPKAFLMENVYGLAYRNQNRAVLERFLNGVEEAGYCVDYRILLAADFGVPQLRQRLCCVGLREDLVSVAPGAWRFAWPASTHAGPHETRKAWDRGLPPHVTSGEALAGLDDNPAEPEEVVAGTYAAELTEVPPGGNYLWWTAHRGHPEPRFEWRSRYWNFLLKLDPDRPSPTIQGQPGPWVGPFHWDSRRLRVNELKRLMAFPDDFVVLGSRRAQQLQLGNAVPPVLGEVVARAIADELGHVAAPAPSLLAA